MDCKDAKGMLIDYYYGEVPPERSSALKAHLEACGSCMLELEGVKKTLDAVDGSLSLPEGYWRDYTRGVLDRVERRGQRASTFRLVKGFAAAALVIATVFGVMHMKTGGERGGERAFRDYSLIENLELLQELDLMEGLEDIEAMAEEGV